VPFLAADTECFVPRRPRSKIVRNVATLVVVRRDANETFQHFEATWASRLTGDLELIWDRRNHERRRLDASTSMERRVVDRREPDVDLLGLDETRHGDRRQHTTLRMPERREAERRRRAPNTWATLGFVIAEPEYPAGP
jgi:hypothetical protein